MPDYSKTKIYIIRSPNTANVYIGATTQPLSHRFRDHNAKFRIGKNRTKAVEVLKHGGAYIELLEIFPCQYVEESRARERYWVMQFDNKVNKNTPTGIKMIYSANVKQNKAEYDKEYRKIYEMKIKEHKNQKFECPCGGRYTDGHRARHFRAFKHRMYYFNQHNLFNHLI